MKFSSVMSGENHVTVLWATGTLQRAVRDFVVPLDSTLGQAVFTLSVDSHLSTMRVFSPANVPITSADASTEIIELNCGRFIILKNPAPGLYRVHINGSGRFWTEVTGRSEVFLYGVRFVERGGRPGHEGLFPIAGQPLVGKPATLEASVSGPIKTAAVALVSNTDEPIQPLGMQKLQAAADREFLGKVDLPVFPFRIRVSGSDANGYQYQRVYNPLFHAATVALFLVQGPLARHTPEL